MCPLCAGRPLGSSPCPGEQEAHHHQAVLQPRLGGAGGTGRGDLTGISLGLFLPEGLGLCPELLPTVLCSSLRPKALQCLLLVPTARPGPSSVTTQPPHGGLLAPAQTSAGSTRKSREKQTSYASLLARSPEAAPSRHPAAASRWDLQAATGGCGNVAAELPERQKEGTGLRQASLLFPPWKEGAVRQSPSCLFLCRWVCLQGLTTKQGRVPRLAWFPERN